MDDRLVLGTVAAGCEVQLAVRAASHLVVLVYRGEESALGFRGVAAVVPGNCFGSLHTRPVERQPKHAQ